MRRVVPLILGFLLGLPAAALADEAPALVPRTPAELLTAVQHEIEMLTGPPTIPLAPADWEAYRRHRLARVDVFIGSIRQEARAALAAEITDPGGEAAAGNLDDGASAYEVAVALAATDPATFAEEHFAFEWLALYSAIDELRAVTTAERPERVCPVAAPTWFVDDFSEPRPWGRSHTGIDLNGEFGAPLQAIEVGTVVQANWHWAGGRQVWIRADATGDVYYYAHLESWAAWIWTGTRVEAGDVIGTMGWSGDADSPHLHFGWMPGSDDVDLDNLQDAYPLLLEICR